MTEEKLAEVFEEVSELVELNTQNNINLCRMGGMPTLLELIVCHPSTEIRKATCRVFTGITANNSKV